MTVSNHYIRSRRHRERIINKRINGDGEIIDSFIIDKGHKNGKEIHSVTNTGLIIITNFNTGKMITKLIARPNQIKRYYVDNDKNPPKWLLDLAKWHTLMGYNNIRN